MKKVFALVLFFVASFGVFAQKYIEHTVVKDDTVTNLARKYSVTIYDIHTLNPNAKNGIKLGETILIPKTEKNAKLDKKKGLYHKVETKETLFGISQKHGTTVQAIQEANKDVLTNGLQPGLELLIPTGKKAESSTTIVQNNDIIHIVQPQESVFGITQKYEIQKEELVKNNPNIDYLKNDVIKVGDTLRIPIKKMVSDDKQSFDLIGKKDFKDLKIANSKKKEVVVMVPFRASKVGNAQESFKTDRLLNLAVDWYSGALLAIEDIKKLGGNFNITFYDSEETNTSSSVEHLIKTHNFSNVDVVIGPFFQSNSQKTASLLESKDIIVISPISGEGKAGYKNLYLANPPSEISKKTVLQYLNDKKQNTIAIIDKKKQSSKEFISSNSNGIRFVEFNDKGGINTENLKALLDKEKTNYVILETEATSLVLNTINTLSGLKGTYNIVLVALEKNDAFESDEIKSQSLADLKLHYPSSMDETTTDQVSSFYLEYRNKNNIFPSIPAIKGYDVVYDVLLRLSQKEDFKELADKVATKQQESKFVYVKSPDGGYYNTGVYILYYDEDLTIKEAQ